MQNVLMRGFLMVAVLSSSLASAYQWEEFGSGTYQKAVEKCSERGAYVPDALILRDALKYGRLSDSIPALRGQVFVWTSKIQNGYHVLLNSSAPDVEVAATDVNYPFLIVCQFGDATPVPPTPGPGPVPPSYDACSRYTSLGVTACLNNNACSWSSDSRSCYSKTGFECNTYTQHGVTACLNAKSPRSDDCGWSSNARQCFQEHGLPCNFYTSMGVTACLNSSPQCDWSSQARACYDK